MFSSEDQDPTRAMHRLGNRESVAFGPFRLFPRRRLLAKAGEPVRIGSRAFDLLVALVERPGELVSKDELVARVWPDTIVVQANLAVQIAGLRRALGDGRHGHRYVVNIPGRGYRFVAPVIGGANASSQPTMSRPGWPQAKAACAVPEKLREDEDRRLWGLDVVTFEDS